MKMIVYLLGSLCAICGKSRFQHAIRPFTTEGTDYTEELGEIPFPDFCLDSIVGTAPFA
jgi:hypothetical protein